MTVHMESIAKKLERHIESDARRTETISEELRLLRENHIAHMERDIEGLKTQGTGMAADMHWVKWGIMAVFGTLVAASVSASFRQ